jgi:putative PIN family toxin of toxin-antitoxin system
MAKILIDTNLYISAIIFPDSELSKQLLEIGDKNYLIVPEYVLTEVERVLEEKFGMSSESVDVFFKNFTHELHKNIPSFDLSKYPKMRDPQDVPVLAAAIETNADYLLTGNKDFLELNLDKPKILTISEFYRDWTAERCPYE